MRALAFSGGKDSMACLHFVPDLDCAIYVDTGYSYPETRALVEYAKALLPVHVVKSVRISGIASDVVPFDWTPVGQMISGKKACIIQSYFDCCLQTIGVPLHNKAKELGVTEMVYGQRNEEGHKSIMRDGMTVDGIKRSHPIEGWSEQQVMDFLKTKMAIPEHYAIKHSSLDCYDCTAFRKQSVDRVEWTKKKHPEFHAAYMVRRVALDTALEAA